MKNHLLFGVALMLAGSTPALATGPDIRVTEADVAASNRKVEAAYGALIDMWTKDFKDMRRQFIAPRIANYRGNIRTMCGVMSANNAAYCAATNTIYFDEVFVAGQQKAAARKLGTDGDMAAVGIIAHEMGHAVATELGLSYRIPYENEATADCLAGVFTKVSKDDGSLEAGDLEEAFAGLEAAGDPQVELTGNSRIDSRRVARARLMGHGTSEQRMANFRAGYETGLSVCLPKGSRS
jgi:predicted metalloprotease